MVICRTLTQILKSTSEYCIYRYNNGLGFETTFVLFFRDRNCAAIFHQVASQVLSLKPPDSLLLAKAWKIKLVNEAADDAGGVFDEIVTDMCKVNMEMMSCISYTPCSHIL